MTPEPLRFRSRIDAWLLAIIALSLLAPVLLVLLALRAPERDRLIAVGVVGLTAVLTAGVIAWIYSTTEYVLTASDLDVRSGPMRWSMPIDSIRLVRRTRSILSAPALSLRRLEILHGKSGSIMVSPTDERAFVDALRKRIPTLIVDGMDR